MVEAWWKCKAEWTSEGDQKQGESFEVCETEWELRKQFRYVMAYAEGPQCGKLGGTAGEKYISPVPAVV